MNTAKILLYFMIINLGAVVWLFYTLAFPVQIAVLHNEPFPVYPSEVKRGEEISWKVELTKTNDYRATVNRNIVCADGNLVTLARSETNAPLGERIILNGSVTVPLKTSLGECYIEITPTYHINPLRDITKSYRTQSFNVIE